MKKVIINGKFPHIKPAHKAFISKQAEGSSLKVAVKRALDMIFTDERLKGMREHSLLPATFVVQSADILEEE